MPVGLSRTVRFCINSGRAGGGAWGEPHNSYAAYPSMRGLGRFYELEVRCRGEIEPTTGYFINIKAIDDAVRRAAVPVIESTCAQRPDAEPESVLQEILPALNAALGGRLDAARWHLTPYYSVQMSPHAPTRALLRQQFDFAASHRLHVASLSDAQNREMFGKCNNPRGHGHNYRVEPCVELVLESDSKITGGRPRFGLTDLERITAATIIDRFDHKHLNEDTAEFGERTGLNPSVENIAKVCYDLLRPAISAGAPGGGASLLSVTVWETDKTSATYPA